VLGAWTRAGLGCNDDGDDDDDDDNDVDTSG